MSYPFTILSPEREETHMPFFKTKLSSCLLVASLVSLINGATVRRTESSGTSPAATFRSAQRVTMPEAVP